MIKDDIEKAYISSLSGIAEYKNDKEVYIKKNITIELLSSNSAILRKYSGKKLCWIKSYKNYLLDGKVIEWDVDGGKKESYYKNGKKNGVYKEWFNDGKLALKSEFKDGKLHGEHVVYYWGSKQPAEIDYYKEGKWQGYRCFGPKGKMLSEYFKHGIK